MDAMIMLRTLRRRGYSTAVEGGGLKLRGPAKLPEAARAAILQHRDELVRLVEEEIVVDELEVFEMAREIFGQEKRGAA